MLREIMSEEEWNHLVNVHGGHPLQLWGWGEVKRHNGWSVVRLELQNEPWCGVQVLIRTLPAPLVSFAYIPRGPVGSASQSSLDELSKYIKKKYKSVVLSMEPDVEDLVTPKGWKRSKNTVLLPRTLKLNLQKSEEELLSDIVSKRRYDIRTSTKKVHEFRNIQSDEDLEICLDLYDDTAARAGFSLHDREYYRGIHHMLGNHSVIRAAWNEAGKLLAFTWFVVSKDIAFELYSGISKEGQELRANYGLKWSCITEMKSRGMSVYDFNGLLNDGISTFKKSFASHENQLVGILDKPLSPFYFTWSKGLPAAKKAVWTIKKMSKQNS